jgi:AbrB family looped-hinge helix DNA binding protein
MDKSVSATISARFRIVIPREIRAQFNIKPGQKVVFIPYRKTLRLLIVPSIEEAYGFLAGMDTSVERDEEDRL